MKKTILHIIYNLGRGGAETMLVTVVKELKEYNNIIVTLYDENHFGDELECDQNISLNLKSKYLLPQASIRLRKIIKENNVALVHSHLFWPTVLARMATPQNIPLITTIHAFVGTSLEYKNWHLRWIDKLTYRFKKSVIIAVAKGALNEYFFLLKRKPYKAHVLYTLVDTRIFNKTNSLPAIDSKIFRVIAVGALRRQKNFAFLINSFGQLQQQPIELSIYGIGPLQEQLQTLLKENNITNVMLKGQVNNINEVIRQYDLFVMSSIYEGFSLSVLEAMALGMPLLLPDIASFKEQCADTAVYYKLNDSADFIKKLFQLKNDKEQLKKLGDDAKLRVLENYTLVHHMQQLREIYKDTIESW